MCVILTLPATSTCTLRVHWNDLMCWWYQDALCIRLSLRGATRLRSDLSLSRLLLRWHTQDSWPPGVLSADSPMSSCNPARGYVPHEESNVRPTGYQLTHINAQVSSLCDEVPHFLNPSCLIRKICPEKSYESHTSWTCRFCVVPESELTQRRLNVSDQ